MLNFETSYLVRLDLDDAGYEAVRRLAAQGEIATSWHAHA